ERQFFCISILTVLVYHETGSQGNLYVHLTADIEKETDQSGSLFSPFIISQKAKSHIPGIIFPAAEDQTQPSLLKMSFHLYPDTRSNDCTVPEFPVFPLVFPLVVLLSCPLL